MNKIGNAIWNRVSLSASYLYIDGNVPHFVQRQQIRDYFRLTLFPHRNCYKSPILILDSHVLKQLPSASLFRKDRTGLVRVIENLESCGISIIFHFPGLEIQEIEVWVKKKGHGKAKYFLRIKRQRDQKLKKKTKKQRSQKPNFNSIKKINTSIPSMRHNNRLPDAMHVEPVTSYHAHQFLDHFGTISFSFERCGAVCRLPDECMNCIS